MELTEQTKEKIYDVFRAVQYGRITFFIAKDKNKIGYTIEQSKEIILNEMTTAGPINFSLVESDHVT